MRKRKLSPTKLITVGYIIIIIVGTLLLMLPVSSRSGDATSLKNALFTATSATCVTGLVVYDTYTYWSAFGQAVILSLIQIGGLGFITLAIFAISLTKKKIGIRERFIVQESLASPQVGGVIRMAKFIVTSAISVEVVGAVLLSFVFVPQFGAEGIWFSVFHSVSAFCNAGFDLMGKVSPGSSLISYGDNWYLNIVIMALIIIGGIGFFTWMDVVNNKHRLRRYKLQSKMVLVFSAVLIVAGTAVIFAVEYGGVAFEGKSFGDKLLLSLFQAVSPRTAGFATTDLTQLGISGKLVMTVLMAIGGSTGSTAGGIKTNTVMVLLFSIFAQYRKKKEVELFGRRIDGDVLRQACCVLMIFVTLAFICAVAIAAIEPLTLDAVLFEVVSALGTVGLSLGVTAQLSTVSQIIIILLMFIGRVGSITVLLMFTSGNLSEIQSKYPQEKIMVG
ncbi:MAG: Trk family potassium uptake protein [Oscillospiraceae bacterium]|nr:Trk family potassium uptake protein [Oscillospiraceae bacterium]MBQ9938956.1 Trk family potassium uptake protein [Oscillospiraceae bacterium]